MASIAAWVSAYAVSSTRRASGKKSIASLEELDAAHLRHPVVGDEHRDGVAAQLEFLERVEGVGAGFGSDDAVSLAVVASEIAGDGARHCRVVVDGENDGFSGLRGRGGHRI